MILITSEIWYDSLIGALKGGYKGEKQGRKEKICN
jgi:hypothetical protein